VLPDPFWGWGRGEITRDPRNEPHPRPGPKVKNGWPKRFGCRTAEIEISYGECPQALQVVLSA